MNIDTNYSTNLAYLIGDPMFCIGFIFSKHTNTLVK